MVNNITKKIPITDKTKDSYGRINPAITGMVGIDINTLTEVKERGNIRERLTMIYNLITSGELSFLNLQSIPEDYSMREDRLAREDYVKVKPAIITPELSDREIRALTAVKAEDSIDKETIDQSKLVSGKWKSGSSLFHYKMCSKYQKDSEKVLAITSAGISGTSYLMMQVAKNYNIDLANFRLALLGWMIPARDHTFHEIMTACNIFDKNLEYINTKERYRHISPLTEEELKNNVAENKKFPDQMME